MILDTSALVAILKEEVGYEHLVLAISEADDLRISAASLLELYLVAEGGKAELRTDADDLLVVIRPAVEPVTEAQVRIALAGFRAYGKGMGHPAQLNFGDCFSYALAKERDEPLLFVGDDFSQTDIRPAIVKT